VRVRRLVVGKGVTKRPVPEVEEWVRRYFEVEVVLPEDYKPEDIEDGRLWAERLIDAWLKAEEMAIPVGVELSAEELEELPWRLYHEGGRAGWIFREPRVGFTEEQLEIVRRLVQRIEKEDVVAIGDFEYRFSGVDKQFISRRPKR